MIRRAVGVLLTGMGRDGAAGMLAMRRVGAFTIGQDEGTSAVWGMPAAAAKLDAVDRELPLPVTLALGMPANERMDSVVEKATELGVQRIVPLLCEFSVVRLDVAELQPRTSHWRGVAIAACEQCRREVAWLRDVFAACAAIAPIPDAPASAIETGIPGLDAIALVRKLDELGSIQWPCNAGAPDGTPIALGYHTGHWEIGLLVEAAARGVPSIVVAGPDNAATELVEDRSAFVRTKATRAFSNS